MAAGDITQGHRLPDATLGEPGPGWEAWESDPQPGDYMRVDHGGDRPPYWYVRDPRGGCGTIVTHTVTELDDRTITVSPSIVCDGWHGYLERGVWREV